jgi:2-(1,2-epoxy-1,2-dihydrophenyl)acetyl-CoA isomerase
MPNGMNDDPGPEVLIERRDRIAVLWFNRERESNAIGWSLGKNLLAALDELENDESISAIVLSGKGKAFCAGAKLGEVVRPEGVDPDEQYRGFRDVVRAVSRIRNHELPIVCALNGAAVGGGAAIGLACDLVVASERGFYLFAFGRMGASAADMGCSYLLPRIVGASRARHMLLTGARIGAAEGQRYGLFIDVVPEDRLMETALELARKVVESGPRRALAATKQVIMRGETTDFETCLFYERYLQSYFLNSDEHKRRLNSFLAAKAAEAERR